MKTFSVIIPYYNSEKTIAGALESVIDQTFADYEVILVNDGSTDNGRAVVENYMKKYRHISISHYYQKNAGPSEARNFAASKASGEYLAFLDADDSWVNTKLQVQVQIMKQGNIDLLGSNINIVKSNGKITRKYFVRNELEYISFYKLLFKHYFCISSVSVKKRIFDDMGGFLEKHKYTEDTLLFARITRRYKAAVSNDFLANVYKPLFGAGGLSANLGETNRYEMAVFKILKSENVKSCNKISVPLYYLAVLFSLLKHLRRIIITIFRKL
ncbi:MAG: glycosyltransferase family 2 protein [Bacteroidetes bacterium]|nr:glycosyltransferase family 2 protein [Bacteroidota bacterium]